MDKKIFSLTDPVLKKKSKRWYIEFRKVFPGGARQGVKVYAGMNYAKTDAEKQKLATDYINNFPANYLKSYNNPQVTKKFSPQVEKFFLVKSMDWEGRSYDTYRNRIGIFMNWHQQNCSYGPERLTFYDAIAFMQYLRRVRKIGDTTWNAYRATLVELYTFWKVKNNPFIEVKKFRDSKTPQKIFTPEERKQLWEHVKKELPEFTVYIGLIYFCFLRPPNEIINLKIRDIDFDRKTVFVNRLSSKPKNKRTHRIPNVFLPYIQQLKKLPADWYVISRKLQPGPLKCARGLVLRNMRRLLDSFGFDHRYSSYSWRHAGAVEFFEQYHDIYLVQQGMRHSSVQTTEKYLKNWEVMDDPACLSGT